MAATSEEASRTLQRLQVALDEVNLLCHEVSVAAPHIVFVGIALDFRTMHISNTASRTWKLYKGIRSVRKKGYASTSVIDILLGHIVHYFMLQPACLAILGHLYEFVDRSNHAVRKLPVGALEELRQVQDFFFLAGRVVLDPPFCNMALLGDSSSRGYSLAAAEVTEEEFHYMARYRDKWRFQLVEDVPEVVEPAVRPWVPAAGVGPLNHFLAPVSLGSQCRGRVDIPLREVEVVGLVPEIPKAVLQTERWSMLLVGAWAYLEPIRVMEAWVMVLGLKRILRGVRWHNHGVVTLSDNLSAVLAFDKGRSRDVALRALCCRAAAMVLACNIRWFCTCGRSTTSLITL